MRERIIAGQAPGLHAQQDLFSDPLGHAKPPLQALVAYCHFAVIYRRSPVGLPMPAVLARANNPAWDPDLNRLLQELAWEAVTHHPLSSLAFPLLTPQKSLTADRFTMRRLQTCYPTEGLLSVEFGRCGAFSPPHNE